MSTDIEQCAYRFQVGSISCTIVSDGSATYHNPAELFFPDAPRAALDSALRGHGILAETWHEYVSPYVALLIRTGHQQVLVDTGGGGFAPSNGHLLENLRAEGVDLGAIDLVVLTHAHPDHIGAVLDAEQRPAFPNARYVMWRDEWQYWTGSPDLSGLRIPERMKQGLTMSPKRRLPPLESRLDLLDHDTELASGVRAVPAPGHTPGHLVVDVASEGEHLLWSGDMVLHPVNVGHPDWCAAVDLSPEQATASRHQLLALAADENRLLHAAHFPWPGVGHVRRQGQSFRWEPTT